MYIEIIENSEVPIYLQLANEVIRNIAECEVAPYEKLPSVRSLARDLQINMHTVSKSYQYLADKKFIEIQPKSGAIVHPNARRKASNKEIEDLKLRLRPIINEAHCLDVTDEMIYNWLKEEK